MVHDDEDGDTFINDDKLSSTSGLLKTDESRKESMTPAAGDDEDCLSLSGQDSLNLEDVSGGLGVSLVGSSLASIVFVLLKKSLLP